jgi:uncharacterized protein YndB with AHSA1/START domain
MMSASSGDEVRVAVTVPLPIGEAFRVFTEEIDLWWRRGVRFRSAGKRRGMIRLETRQHGRLFESIDTDDGELVIEAGRVTTWDPPNRLVLQWRASNFAEHEITEIEVLFTARGDKTLVSLAHRGFAALRADHPVRHGQDAAGTVRSFGLWWRDQFASLLELLPEPDGPDG